MARPSVKPWRSIVPHRRPGVRHAPIGRQGLFDHKADLPKPCQGRELSLKTAATGVSIPSIRCVKYFKEKKLMKYASGRRGAMRRLFAPERRKGLCPGGRGCGRPGAACLPPPHQPSGGHRLTGGLGFQHPPGHGEEWPSLHPLGEPAAVLTILRLDGQGRGSWHPLRHLRAGRPDGSARGEVRLGADGWINTRWTARSPTEPFGWVGWRPPPAGPGGRNPLTAFPPERRCASPHRGWSRYRF
jgi:hypothetical protein